MNKLALMHKAKSEYAYAYDNKTLHITIRTAKDDITTAFLVFGDPFDWTDGKWVVSREIMEKKYQTDLFDYYFLAITPKDYRVKYAFILTDNANNSFIYGSKYIEDFTFDKDNITYNLQNFFNYPFLNVEDLAKTPKWVKDTIWYQIFPDRFYTDKPLLSWGKTPVRNNEIYGGDIKGIIKKIPYLHNLGITGIYFTPMFESRSAHKYDTTNYFKIDPSFGTNEDFKALVETAHDNNIKIMLDGVFNHSGILHPFFQDLALNNENSIYKNSFHVKEFPVINFETKDGLPIKHTNMALNYHTFAYTPHMPKWNTDDSLTSEHLLNVITYWINEYDIDGWRLDVSNEVSHDFLRKIKIVSRIAKKDTFILGENWDQSLPWLNGDQLDSVMNYDLSYAIWEFFEHKITLKAFKDLLMTYLALTPKNVMENMFNLLDSHDTVRILRRLGDNINRVKLAYLFMFLSAGAPNIYYGGEIGLTGDHDPDNRRCMIWDNNYTNMDLFSFLQKLIQLRKVHKSFSTYDYHFIDDDILAFYKVNDDEFILTIMNNNIYPISFSLPNEYIGRYVDLFSNKDANYDKISLEAYQFIILKRSKS